MLLLSGGDPRVGPDTPDCLRWQQDTDARGIQHRGTRLRPAAEAVTVRVRDGEVLLTDGPYAETKEEVGGFEIIEADDLDQVIERAAAHPSAAGFVEIRPFPQED
jgi:hypothetical protein